jgi:ketosteroid isomerase-like protein
MSETKQNRADEIEVVREAYAALNRGDVAGFVRQFDEGVERIEEFSGFTCAGLPAMVDHVTKGRGTWTEGGCYPQRFVVAGDRIVVFVHIHVLVKGESQWRDGHTVDIFTFRDGKVIEFRSFLDQEKAMAWASISA